MSVSIEGYTKESYDSFTVDIDETISADLERADYEVRNKTRDLGVLLVNNRDINGEFVKSFWTDLVEKVKRYKDLKGMVSDTIITPAADEFFGYHGIGVNWNHTFKTNVIEVTRARSLDVEEESEYYGIMIIPEDADPVFLKNRDALEYGVNSSDAYDLVYDFIAESYSNTINDAIIDFVKRKNDEQIDYRNRCEEVTKVVDRLIMERGGINFPCNWTYDFRNNMIIVSRTFGE